MNVKITPHFDHTSLKSPIEYHYPPTNPFVKETHSKLTPPNQTILPKKNIQQITTKSPSPLKKITPKSSIPSTTSTKKTEMIGPYQIKKQIGAGNMGKVKLGLDTRTNRMVAIKIIPRQTPKTKVFFPKLRKYAKIYSSEILSKNNSNLELYKRDFQIPQGDPKNLSPFAIKFLNSLQTETSNEYETKNDLLNKRQPRIIFTTKDRENRESKDIRIYREIAISQLLHHPNICELYEVAVHPGSFYLISELVAGGQMLDYIIRRGRLKESHAQKFARQIASALDYCHKNSIVHRDLKIENILVTSKGDAKIIDFGLSNLYSSRNPLLTYCGSLYFAAPELLCSKPYMGPEVDIWSFGVVLFVLICGRVPFDDPSMHVLYSKIKSGKFTMPLFITSDCTHLLNRLLTVNPKSRATMAEILNHPWMIKDHPGPPPSYIPKRTPLVDPSQIDKNIVEIISSYSGFGFGSYEDTYDYIYSKILSKPYRKYLSDKYSTYVDYIRNINISQLTLELNPEKPQLYDPFSNNSKNSDFNSIHKSNTYQSDKTNTLPSPFINLESKKTEKELNQENLSQFVNTALNFDFNQSIYSSKTSDSENVNITEVSGKHESYKISDINDEKFLNKTADFRTSMIDQKETKTSMQLVRENNAELSAAREKYLNDPTQIKRHSMPQSQIINDSLDKNTDIPGYRRLIKTDTVSKLIPNDLNSFDKVFESFNELVAQDPVLNIYYLVKEKLERMARWQIKIFETQDKVPKLDYKDSFVTTPTNESHLNSTKLENNPFVVNSNKSHINPKQTPTLVNSMLFQTENNLLDQNKNPNLQEKMHSDPTKEETIDDMFLRLKQTKIQKSHSKNTNFGEWSQKTESPISFFDSPILRINSQGMNQQLNNKTESFSLSNFNQKDFEQPDKEETKVMKEKYGGSLLTRELNKYSSVDNNLNVLKGFKKTETQDDSRKSISTDVLSSNDHNSFPTHRMHSRIKSNEKPFDLGLNITFSPDNLFLRYSFSSPRSPIQKLTDFKRKTLGPTTKLSDLGDSKVFNHNTINTVNKNKGLNLEKIRSISNIKGLFAGVSGKKGFKESNLNDSTTMEIEKDEKKDIEDSDIVMKKDFNLVLNHISMENENILLENIDPRVKLDILSSGKIRSMNSQMDIQRNQEEPTHKSRLKILTGGLGNLVIPTGPRNSLLNDKIVINKAHDSFITENSRSSISRTVSQSNKSGGGKILLKKLPRAEKSKYSDISVNINTNTSYHNYNEKFAQSDFGDKGKEMRAVNNYTYGGGDINPGNSAYSDLALYRMDEHQNQYNRDVNRYENYPLSSGLQETVPVKGKIIGISDMPPSSTTIKSSASYKPSLASGNSFRASLFNKKSFMSGILKTKNSIIGSSSQSEEPQRSTAFLGNYASDDERQQGGKDDLFDSLEDLNVNKSEVFGGRSKGGLANERETKKGSSGSKKGTKLFMEVKKKLGFLKTKQKK
ncbi:hypothetical protein BB558_005085 [Smittium angustum]|uniref:Protein kinase domain-containing protein n=1 Tax=Smittium angustum TaxID=133377 RepID=A0A2U1J1L0_SMIAN|nr:hypothetical protein BB558_005085 [Smittium angustum]